MPEEAFEPSPEEIDRIFRKLDKNAEDGGYHLNPDEEFTKDLVWGLMMNERRYGYRACPCRLADGDIEKDRDIICPCDYRDPDLNEFGACYCALYVNDEIRSGVKKPKPIPERRPSEEERERLRKEKEERNKEIASQGGVSSKFPLPVWRCSVCGYLCAREEPPLICPVCKAKKDRFERFA
ncbi:MAG: ferredoxin-thioredoxin reductase catalytic domain-containing protein [Thermoplasmatota archaeon]